MSRPSHPLSTLACALACCVSGLSSSACRGGPTITTGHNLGVATDLFDVSRGVEITSFSPQFAGLGGSDPRSALGFVNDDFVEPFDAIFSDDLPVGSVSQITFRLPNPVTLTGFSLILADDSNTGPPQRGARSYRLLASADGTDFATVSESSLGANYTTSYGDSVITITDDDPTRVAGARYFRIELARSMDWGPRIIELDGFCVAPEPSTLISGGLAGAVGLGLAWRRRRPRATVAA